MTKPQEKPTAKFTVKKRSPKPVPDFFQNVTPFSHPIQELLESQTNRTPLPTPPASDVREEESRTSEVLNLGRPSAPITEITSDARNTVPRAPETNILGRPNTKTSDTNTSAPFPSRAPETLNLGRPTQKISDAKAPETPFRAPEKIPISDTKTSEKKTSDARESKIGRGAYDTRYERKRQADESRDRINLRLNAVLGKQIRVFCAEQGMELAEFFELAAVAWMENLGRPSEKISDTKAPHDDRRLMMWQTRPLIINLYLAYNSKNKWKMHDDKVAAALNEADPRLIELGIIQTQFNARFKRINSFGYYLGGIEEWLHNTEVSVETLDFMVKHYRAKWAAATGQAAPATENPNTEK